MNDERQKVKAQLPYSDLTDGELLGLTLEQQSLTEGAKDALAAELRRRGLDEAEIAAFQQDAERAKARHARWHKMQRMRLRELFSLLMIWPGMLLIPFGLVLALVLALDPLLRDVLGLGLHQANLFEEIVAIGVVVLCLVTEAALIVSKRSDATIRHWLPGSAPKPRSEEEKHRAHQRICPARNVGIALLLFVFSFYLLFLNVRDVEGWHFLRGQPSPVGWSCIDTFSSIFLVIFLSYLLTKAPCFREKLWLAFATADFILNLPKHLLHTLSGNELSLSRHISLVLWAAATIVALSFVKSAWHGPAARNLDRQV